VLGNYDIAYNTAAFTINKANPPITAWPTASAITYGQTLAFSTLSGGTTTVIGSFGFTTPGTAPNAGTASQDVTFTSTDTNYHNNAGTASVTVNKANQITLITVAPINLVYGSTAMLSTTGGSGTGAVTFSGGISTGCSVTGSSLSVTNAGGTCSVTATKAADANYNLTTSSSVSVTLTKAAASVRIASDNNPLAFSNSVTFTANVSSITGTPTGSVTFKDSTTVLGIGSLVNGSATYSTDALAIGSHSITAEYGGDTNFASSTSAIIVQTVMLYGDLNGDGAVDIADALKTLRISAGLDVPSASDYSNGDVAPLANSQRYPDGKIDIDDVVAILRKAVGLPSW
jgi:hypothetical protein